MILPRLAAIKGFWVYFSMCTAFLSVPSNTPMDLALSKKKSFLLQLLHKWSVPELDINTIPHLLHLGLSLKKLKLSIQLLQSPVFLDVKNISLQSRHFGGKIKL
jgi:hypothetical protein